MKVAKLQNTMAYLNSVDGAWEALFEEDWQPGLAVRPGRMLLATS
jgi:hypothetical protein